MKKTKDPFKDYLNSKLSKLCTARDVISDKIGETIDNKTANKLIEVKEMLKKEIDHCRYDVKTN